MKNTQTKRIVIIEDQEKHIADARNYFATVPGVMVDFARNYNECGSQIYDSDNPRKGQRKPGQNWCAPRKDLAGVISDIYFPSYDGDECGDSNPIGVRVAVELSSEGIPFVLNTAGYHHGPKYEWIHRLCRNQMWALVDSGQNPHQEAGAKNWEGAWRSLEYRIKKGVTE